MKKPLKIILIILAVIVGLVAALLIWLTATQLNVKTETAVVTHGENSTASFAPGDDVSILTWNVGYAGLGRSPISLWTAASRCVHRARPSWKRIWTASSAP